MMMRRQKGSKRESGEEAPRIAAVSVLFVESVSECLEGLGGPDWQRRSRRKGSLWESQCMSVCGCERERGQCYFNPKLTSGCHTHTHTPCCSSLLTPQSIYLQTSCHSPHCRFLSFSGFPFLSPLAVFLSFLFFSRSSTQLHRYYVTSPPEDWRAVRSFLVYCMLAVLLTHQISWLSDPVTDHLVTLATRSYRLLKVLI